MQEIHYLIMKPFGVDKMSSWRIACTCEESSWTMKSAVAYSDLATEKEEDD